MTDQQNQEQPVKLIQPLETTPQVGEHPCTPLPPELPLQTKPKSPILGILTILIAFAWLWAAWFPINREIHLIILGLSGNLIQQSFFPGAERLSTEEIKRAEQILKELTILKYVWLSTMTFIACWLIMAGASGIARIRSKRNTSWFAPGVATLCLAGACFTGYLAISKTLYADVEKTNLTTEAHAESNELQSNDDKSLSERIADAQEVGTTGLVKTEVDQEAVSTVNMKQLTHNAAKVAPGWTLLTTFLVSTTVFCLIFSSWYGRFSTLFGVVLIVIALRFWLHSLRNVTPEWYLSLGDKPGMYWEIALASCAAVLSVFLAAGFTRKRAAIWLLIFFMLVVAVSLLSYFILMPFPAVATWTVMMILGLASVCLGVLVQRWSNLLFVLSQPFVYLATLVTAGGLYFALEHEMLGDKMTIWSFLGILVLQSVVMWVIFLANPRKKHA